MRSNYACKLFAVLSLTIYSTHSFAAIDGKNLYQLADDYKEFSTKHKMSSTSAGTFIGYVTGIATILNIQGKICISGDVSTGKVVDSVQNYIQDNPQFKSISEGSIVVMLALSETYKCK
ncbi:Rap1a/Tai family immunity protein [Pantoea sp. GM_Pan_4]|uniref:Rap1a/Tai family immunity protein n=1 Tax=Pantoea sp. GM_Pan_4 TaxID=2937389 RepID=UPI00226B3A87|nr:Rap1a/Tai family immunity protein [Pantoea sp. GM_Pan_4]